MHRFRVFALLFLLLAFLLVPMNGLLEARESDSTTIVRNMTFNSGWKFAWQATSTLPQELSRRFWPRFPFLCFN